MYTFDNFEAIKSRFENDSVKPPQKIRLKKRIPKMQGLDFKQTLLPVKKVKREEKKIDIETEDQEEIKQSDDEEEEEEEDEEEEEEEDDEEEEIKQSEDEEEEIKQSDDEEEEEEEEEDEDEEEEIKQSEDEEEENEQINRNTIYEYDGKKYTIDNEKFLQKRFDDIEPDTTYKMNMCIYKCVRDGYSPYLLYLMKYDATAKTYIFPNESEIQMGSEDESVDEVEEKVMNIFKESLFNIYPPNEFEPSEESTDLYEEDLFKGFFLHNKRKEMTMVYDATRVNVPLESNVYCWVSPYEIFVSKKMKSIPISQSVEAIFDEIAEASSNRHDFYHLKQLPENTLVKTPYILFMCKQSESSGTGFLLIDVFNTKKTTYTSVESTTDESEIQIETIIYPTVQHPLIGNYTLFSSFPFSTSNLVKRFAVFVDTDDLHPLYVEPSDNDTLTTLYDIDKEQYTSIAFIENESQLWCVKSPDFFTEMPDNGNYLLESENSAPIITSEDDMEKGSEKESIYEEKDQEQESENEPIGEPKQEPESEEEPVGEPKQESESVGEPVVEEKENEPIGEPKQEKEQLKQESVGEPESEKEQLKQEPVVTPMNNQK
jgi:hypothetical protein